MHALLSQELVSVLPTTGIWIEEGNIMHPPPVTAAVALDVKQKLTPVRFSKTDDRFTICPVYPAATPQLRDAPRSVKEGAPIKGTGMKACEGFRSGARSCIIRCRKSTCSDTGDWIVAERNGIRYIPDHVNGDTLLRLKGCGMWTDGDRLSFPGITFMDSYSEHANAKQVIIEVRGVSFENTSMEELFVLRELDRMSSLMKIRLGNKEVGFWVYDGLTDDPAPDVKKTVTVTETVGDRRFETHLLSGFEQVIGSIISLEECEACMTKVVGLFKSKGMNPPGVENRTYCRMASVKKNRVSGVIRSLRNDLSVAEIEGMRDDDLTAAGFIPAVDIVGVMVGEIATLGKLYARMGWELGRILACIHRSGILWGTFTDHNLQELHCNAHTDNLVVLSELQAENGDGTYQILAPVDFDMAFLAEEAVNVWNVTPNPDSEIGTFMYATELGSLVADLAGITACVEGVSTAIRSREQPVGSVGDLLWVMRDITTRECIQAYMDPQCSDWTGLAVGDAYRLINCALQSTCEMQS